MKKEQDEPIVHFAHRNCLQPRQQATSSLLLLPAVCVRQYLMCDEQVYCCGANVVLLSVMACTVAEGKRCIMTKVCLVCSLIQLWVGQQHNFVASIAIMPI